MVDDTTVSDELRAVLEALHAGNPRNRVLTERSSGAVLLATRQGLVVAVSPRAAEQLGRTRAALLGASLTDLLDGDSATGDLAVLLALPRGRVLRRTLGLRRGDGARVALPASARRLSDDRLQLVLEDPTPSRPTTSAPRRGSESPTPLVLADAYHDAVTGLTSRLLVRDRLSTALVQAYRCRTRVAVLHLDLDRFSAANASLGRDQGDRLLRSVGRRLVEAVREGDTVARLDADAFVTVLSGLRGVEDARHVAEKVMEAIRRPFALPGQTVRVTASLGVSVFPEHGSDAGALLAASRDAAHRARDAGGDRFESCAVVVSPGGYDALELETGLRALGSGRLALNHTPSSPGVLHYQPILNLNTSRVVAVEALLRWQHPERGLVVPQSFLSRADFTGLILAIEPWILKTAAVQAREWQRQESGLRVAVNLSPPELVGRGLLERVKSALEETGLLPRLLELELPEEVVSAPARSVDLLHRLKALGVALVLDGMAVRHPVLARLSELPVDGVKLDLTSLGRQTPRAEEISLLGTMAAVARALDLRVSAQGVETPDQVELLRRLGCVEAQGFHIGRPAPAAAIGERLARQAPPPAGAQEA